MSGCLLWLLVGGRLVSLSRSRTGGTNSKERRCELVRVRAGPSEAAKILVTDPNPNLSGTSNLDRWCQSISYHILSHVSEGVW